MLEDTEVHIGRAGRPAAVLERIVDVTNQREHVDHQVRDHADHQKRGREGPISLIISRTKIIRR